jgi:hypothetical protein
LADNAANADIVALLGADGGENTAAVSGDLSSDLVGLKRENHIADLDLVTDFNVPFGNLAAADGLTKGRDFDVGHGRIGGWFFA